MKLFCRQAGTRCQGLLLSHRLGEILKSYPVLSLYVVVHSCDLWVRDREKARIEYELADGDNNGTDEECIYVTDWDRIVWGRIN